MGNYCCVAQIWVLSLGTCCPPREQRLFVSCSPVPHHVVPERPLEEHGWYQNHKIFHDIFLKNFIILLIIKKKC